jgi:lipoprotein-anchoring transpeptidase ErfK/SrfK
MRKAPVVRGARTNAPRGRERKLAAPAAFVFVLLVLATAAALLVPTAALASGKPYGIKPPPHKHRPKPKPKPKPSLYNVTTNFAIAIRREPAYRRPTTRSDVVRSLEYYTPDSEALQTYRFISSRRVGTTTWEHIDVPMRPNGQTGWVKRSWLGPAMVSHLLVVVDLQKEKLTVYRMGQKIFSTRVGVGNYTLGRQTPTGRFWIAEEFPSSDSFYGPWAFGTTDYAADTEFPDDSIVGIHGTSEPWLIPGDPSHGCIRVKDPDILKLKKLLRIGAALWIKDAFKS